MFIFRWAKNLIELGVDFATHSPDTTKGESLAWSEGTLSAAQAVTNWYNDFNLFQVGHPQFYKKAGSDLNMHKKLNLDLKICLKNWSVGFKRKK